MYFDLKKDITNGYAKVTIDGDTFEGRFKDGKPYGKGRGVLHLKDGKIYEGELKAGNVKGCARFSDGSIYEGEIKQGKRSGKGIMRYSNGVVYTGGFKDNKYNGKGSLHCNKFDIEGTFKDGKIEKGKKIRLDDTIDGYEMFGKRFKIENIIYSAKSEELTKKELNNLISIYGGEISERCISQGKVNYVIEYLLNGLGMYEGVFKECTADGNGKLMYSNGDIYEGKFKNGEIYGKGKLTFNTRGISEGEFKNGLLEGKGTTSFPSWGTYTGEFFRGKPHGKGKMKYANGDIYEGDFYMGVANGKGKLTRTNGKV